MELGQTVGMVPVAGIEWVRTVGGSLQVPIRWSARRVCRIVEHQIGSTTPPRLQIAVVDTVAQDHMATAAAEPAEARCKSCLMDIVETAVGAVPEGIPVDIVGNFPAFAALHTAALACIHSLQDPARFRCFLPRAQTSPVVDIDQNFEDLVYNFDSLTAHIVVSDVRRLPFQACSPPVALPPAYRYPIIDSLWATVGALRMMPVFRTVQLTPGADRPKLRILPVRL